MNTAFIKRLLWPVILIFFVLMSGCSGADQISPTPIISSTALPSATPTLPALTPSPTVAALEKTLTSTIPAPQTNLISVKDSASFVSENYPDNSVLKPGEKFVKTFKIKNAGSIPWPTSYSLVLDADPQNETLGSPSQINLPQETPPGGIVSLSIPLTASTVPGTYTVYWALKNEHHETIQVDGVSQIWAKIIVCDPNQPCNPPVVGSAAAGGVSATLTNFASGGQSATASFCMTLPNRNYGPQGGSVSLKVDQKTVMASSGGSLASGCFEFEFPVGATELSQAQHVAISIEQVRMMGGDPYLDKACQAARLNLMAQYPGLDFQCHFSMAGYYTDLQLPDGMTKEQAQQIIFDAIEGAIYGPWALTIK